jgi:hypothetical protein
MYDIYIYTIYRYPEHATALGGYSISWEDGHGFATGMGLMGLLCLGFRGRCGRHACVPSSSPERV